MSKTSDKNNSYTHPALMYLSMLATSTAFQPFITMAAKLNANKVANQATYPYAFSGILKTPIGCFVKDSSLILQRRAFASLIPANISLYLRDNHNMTDKELVVINSTIETSLALALEPVEKFNLANRQAFPLTDKKGAGLNLLTSDEAAFKAAQGNDVLKFDTLKERQLIFKSNLPYCAVAMAARNSMFSSAAFLSRPLARDFIEQYGDEIEKVGISKEQQENIITQSIRLGFSAATAPFDAVVTRLCSGQFHATDVLKITFQNPRTLFAGAIARSVQCFLASNTIVQGETLAKTFSKYLDQDEAKLTPDKFDGIDPVKEVKEVQKIIDADRVRKLEENPNPDVKSPTVKGDNPSKNKDKTR